MGVQRRQAVFMIEFDHLAISTVVPSEDNDPLLGCAHWGTAGNGDIKAGMKLSATTPHGMVAFAERRSEQAFDRPDETSPVLRRQRGVAFKIVLLSDPPGVAVFAAGLRWHRRSEQLFLGGHTQLLTAQEVIWVIEAIGALEGLSADAVHVSKV
jgi:hypothetical protein